MNKERDLPAVGEKVWVVWEHLYHLPESYRVTKEYLVSEGTVSGCVCGKYTDIYVNVKTPEGPVETLRIRREEDDCMHASPRDAAMNAKAMTEEYERAWGWVGSPDIPMRRMWEKYLEEGERDEAEEYHQISGREVGYCRLDHVPHAAP